MRGHTILTSILCGCVLLCSLPAFGQDVTYTITWNPVSDPSVSTVEVYRSTAPGSGFVLIASADASALRYIDEEPDFDVRYYYYLRSRSTLGGLSQPTATVSGMTLGASSPDELKAECEILSSDRIDATTCELSWHTQSATVGKIKYRKMGETEELQSGFTTVFGNDHSMIIENLEENQLYLARAVVWDESSNMWISHEFPFSTQSQAAETFEIATSVQSVTVPEGGTADFGVRLTEDPEGTVSVAVAWGNGDTDMFILDGASMTFDPGNWDVYQTVTVGADEDEDNQNGQAEFFVYVTSGQSVPAVVVTMEEADNEPGSVNPPPNESAQAPVKMYPMPYRPEGGELTIENLPVNGTLAIYDLRGRRVWESSYGNSSETSWDGTNVSAAGVASGRYFVVVRDAQNRMVEKTAILIVH